MENKIQSAVKEVSKPFKFEHWLRFYFVHQAGEDLVIFLSPEHVQKLKEKYGQLSRLAEELNGKVISPQLSQQTIVQYIQQVYDGTKYEVGFIPRVLDSLEFNTEIHGFNIWVSLHEEQLDKKVLDFDTWLEIYDEWKKTENAQKIIMSLKVNGMQNVGSNKLN
ncbi:hypothetical protein KFV02_09530 [Desulfohalobiaceae bacterium Ax17]|jgi:hypothetical protein|uniref:hypothetical protein n=1 Tax=Desulfovulcanus ferrireducens TaxID=2831190 RepID=UPI00207BC030|nr:hypothetical protein [Desulfovulcanus ferrireducens]MBT8764172.1 hypothetical protein [Desulfovulcanus ferrireducens]